MFIRVCNNLTFAVQVDLSRKTPGVVGVLQRAEQGCLLGHSEHQHQYRTQQIAFHHFNGLVLLL